MRKMNQYLQTIDTMYPDSYTREYVFRDDGDMVDPAPLTVAAPNHVFGRFIAVVKTWHMKRAGRLALRELTDAQLLDIGVTRSQARQESAKSRFLV
jgi:uncharacterized protein YjiS (DUF1127 family)